MSTDKRQRFETIIRALLAKTVENGCTEQEALEAAAKAAELMDRYEITLTDEQIVEDGAIREFWQPKNMVEMTIVNWLGVAIGRFTETKVYRSTQGYRQRIIPLAIIGLPSDVQFAKYLANSLCSFGVAGASTVEPRERVNYMKGYCTRVAKRLNEMTQARTQARSGESRALVVVDLKRTAIDAFMRGEGLRLRRSTRQVGAYAGASYRAGEARGDAATFGRPVAAGATTLMIGRRK